MVVELPLDPQRSPSPRPYNHPPPLNHRASPPRGHHPHYSPISAHLTPPGLAQGIDEVKRCGDTATVRAVLKYLAWYDILSYSGSPRRAEVSSLV